MDHFTLSSGSRKKGKEGGPDRRRDDPGPDQGKNPDLDRIKYPSYKLKKPSSPDCIGKFKSRESFGLNPISVFCRIII